MKENFIVHANIISNFGFSQVPHTQKPQRNNHELHIFIMNINADENGKRFSCVCSVECRVGRDCRHILTQKGMHIEIRGVPKGLSLPFLGFKF